MSTKLSEKSRNRAVTMRAVAEAAGVSVATVSRVCTNLDAKRVGPKVKQNVMRVIREMNYTPNLVARQLSVGRTSMIGLLVPSLKGPAPMYPETYDHLEACAFEQDYSVLLGVSRRSHEQELRSITAMLNKRIEGLLWFPTGKKNREAVTLLKESALPTVLLNKQSGADFPSVETNEVLGGRMAAEHLVGLGIKSFICAGMTSDPHSTKRIKGFQQVLSDFGFPCRVIAVQTYSYEAGTQLSKEVLSMKDNVGVFCCSDQLAWGVNSDIYRRKLPAHIVGYGGTTVAAHAEPPFPTIAIDAYEVGRQAVLTLLGLFEGKQPSKKHILVPPKLSLNAG